MNWLVSHGYSVQYPARSRTYLIYNGSGPLPPFPDSVQRLILGVETAPSALAALYAVDNGIDFGSMPAAVPPAAIPPYHILQQAAAEGLRSFDAASQVAAMAAAFQNYSTLGTLSSSIPAGLTTGPDGALWFVDYQQERDRPHHHLRAAVAISHGGRRFVLRQPAQYLSRSERCCGPPNRCHKKSAGSPPPGRLRNIRFPHRSANPGNIALGPDGALFYYAGQLPDRPPRDRRGDYRISDTGCQQLSLRHRGGAGWGALVHRLCPARAIGRKKTAGVISEYPVSSDFSLLQGIAAGLDGAMWFLDEGANQVGRITTAGVVSEYSVPTSNAGIAGIAAGADGALWFTGNRGPADRPHHHGWCDH